MKKIFCELCDGTEFTKENGMFICQGCGTKYTIEEAKAMMKEVEGEGPSPAAGGSSSNANQQQIDNLLILASNAYDASNNQETEGYCNKIIELDVTCYKAWLLKGKAICWMSTFGKPRVVEGANAMRKAVDFAPEEEKKSVAVEALITIKNTCNALCMLAKDNFADSPTDNYRLKFGEFTRTCANATDIFENISDEIKDFSIAQWKAHKKECARLMNISGVAALNTVREKWNDIDHPNTNSLSTYLDWLGEIELIFTDSITFGKAVDEDDSAIITRYKNKIIAIEEPMDACSYKREWNSWTSSYEWVSDQSLTAAAKSSRKASIKKCEEEIKVLEAKAARKAEEEKKAAEEAKKKRIRDYWEARKEEKDKLDAEKKQLTDNQNALGAQIADLDRQIGALQAQMNTAVPAEIELGKIQAQIAELNMRKSNLGLFAGKEKKALADEITNLEGQAATLGTRAQAERNAKAADIQNRIAPLSAKRAELSKEATAIASRISAIDKTFENVPEE